MKVKFDEGEVLYIINIHAANLTSFFLLSHFSYLQSSSGPGCSSMEGWLSESGLYHIQEFSDPPTLAVNPFSWNNKTNNLFLEAPTGVGFSYCETAAECVHDDTTQSVDNLAALVSFFTSYPELQKNDFWITGESYAGTSRTM